MNTGLQDAYNLAWKLALVVEKKADAALLDSYHEERFPVAQRLLNTTDRGFRLIVSDSWLAGITRTDILARIVAGAMKRAPIQRVAFRTVSQIGIHYRGSSLCAGEIPGNAPQAGDRFPWMKGQALDDMQFNLFVAGQDSNESELARVGIPTPSSYLIRPDGYVGLCGTRLDQAAINDYLRQQVRFTA